MPTSPTIIPASTSPFLQIRDFRGTREREKAEIGDFLCFEEPTRPMLREAAEAGFYKSADGSSYPRIQILTIQQILDGKQPEYPLHRRDATFKQAPKARTRRVPHVSLLRHGRSTEIDSEEPVPGQFKGAGRPILRSFAQDAFDSWDTHAEKCDNQPQSKLVK